ncbi:MAG: MHYT domain-containing protein, partial [Woeseia sp.]
MGFGIWTVHVVGMLAQSMPREHHYDVTLMAASLLAAIGASAFVIYVASRSKFSVAQIAISGLLLGSGIATMHYIGMTAVTVQADLVYNPTKVLFSIAIAVTAATA